MSLRDENFKDKHLRKALQHAPDSDVAPSESTRKTVLDYADKALKVQLKPHHESWFARFINAFNAWQIPRWQLTGMGSLAASLLVVVMIWHENPDNPIQVASAPSIEPRPEPELAQNELARDRLAKDRAEASPQPVAPVAAAAPAPEAASAEIAAPKVQGKVTAKAKSTKQEAETAPQAAAIEAPSDKAAVASAPEAASAQEAEKDAASVRLKARAATAEAAPPAPVAVAPAPMSEPAPVKKMKDAEPAQAEAKADLPRAIAAAKPATPSSTLAIALSKQGGQALANQDIQAGKLRILYLSNIAVSGAVNADEATGYRKEVVYVGDEASAKSLALEVEAYNQTMREWYLNQ